MIAIKHNAEHGYDTDVYHIGNATIVDRYFRMDGKRYLSSSTITMSVGRANRFAGKDFEAALAEALEELRKSNPGMANDFDEAFKAELWYGKKTWTNTL